MLKITKSDITDLIEDMRSSPRNRANLNLHPELSDPVQRFINCVDKGIYLRPHKHKYKNETFILIKGQITVITFSDKGDIIDTFLLDRKKQQYVAEVCKNIYHSIYVHTPSIIFEIKQGPYNSHKDFALWSPEEGSNYCISFLNVLKEKFKNE